jgi:hypothetical protein
LPVNLKGISNGYYKLLFKGEYYIYWEVISRDDYDKLRDSGKGTL